MKNEVNANFGLGSKNNRIRPLTNNQTTFYSLTYTEKHMTQYEKQKEINILIKRGQLRHISKMCYTLTNYLETIVLESIEIMRNHLKIPNI